MDYLKSDDFFNEISARCNYINPDLARDVYYSMVKVIVQELRHKGVVRLPDFGDIVVTMHKERTGLNVNSGVMERIPAKRTIKLITDYKLKKYLNSI